MNVLVWPAYNYPTANPYTALLYEHLAPLGVHVHEWSFARAACRRFDLWHIHYADAVVYRTSLLTTLYRLVTFCGSLLLARARGTPILWTVHDLGSHDGRHPRLEAWFWSFFITRVDAYICMSDSSRRLAIQFFPALRSRPAHTVAHGDYRNAYPDTVTREEARRVLRLPDDATVLLHFGLIRPYKNVPALLAALRGVGDSNTILMIAGQPCDVGIARSIAEAARGIDGVRLHLEFIPADRVQHFFKAADLVVLPYRRILNSGTTVLALTFNRPVLVPDQGAMADHRDRVGDQWIRLYPGNLTPDELTAAIDWALRTPRPSRCDPNIPDWPDLAAQTRRVYDELLSTDRT